MRRDYEFFVYILCSRSRKLYVGITNDLIRRVGEHKSGAVEGFTKRYAITRLVYFERFQYVSNAIAREKELKDWRRELKVQLIEAENPTWEDLAADM
ncbi:putative endonuclease [Edaphobacter aggregans]|uniref:Putative endonuclease n=1 Tax=Edaphobacter aggregans TaxID=570835 RepID=A0A428MGV9_9BACT|nr:GIY-YIG nuclease family protein [Edaphobacter aggregans]RSL15969.1 putative endonuclease [Edaphobacter aggregans]